jgi:hypothetical protein
LAKQEMASVVAATNRLKCINLESENCTQTKALRLRFGYVKCEKLNAIPKTFYRTGKYVFTCRVKCGRSVELITLPPWFFRISK